MDDNERDRLIIETHRDVAWLKEWSTNKLIPNMFIILLHAL